MTEMKNLCVNCHAGNATTMIEDEAHSGLIIHPQMDEGAICQDCHLQDTQARLDTFISQGGYGTVIEAVSYTANSTISGDVPKLVEIAEKLSWAVGAVVVFGLWLVLCFLSPQKP